MVAREQIPVTPALITWARSRAGYSLEEAEKFFGTINEWEAGESSPTYVQLEQLSDKFKIPVAVFFFPEPPTLPPIQETFRTLPEADFDAFPPRIKYLLKKAKAFQLNLGELADGGNPAPRQIIKDLAFPVDVKTSVMSQAVREYFGISLVQQQEWPSAEVALENWRDAFHKVGIFVFKDAFKADAFSGFCLYDDVFPLIYVNNTTAKTRQIFTLFHELAHLLFRTSGVDELGDAYISHLAGESRQIEILCNRFAAEFLLPDIEFEKLLAGKEPTEEFAAQLAETFNVSRELVFRKFLDRKLITSDDYEAAAALWAGQKKQKSGGDYYNNQIAYLGESYIQLAFQRFNQNRINESQLADYLGIPAKNVATLEARFSGRRE